MPTSDTTHWSDIADVLRGDAGARERFCARYEPLIRAWLVARWRCSSADDRVANTTQEVLLRCLRSDGALAGVERDARRFRAYLWGVVTHVAQESKRQVARDRAEPFRPSEVALPAPGDSAATLFDRAFAQTLIGEAWSAVEARLMRKPSGAERLAVLQLRYREDLPAEEVRARLGLASVRDVHRIAALGRYHFRHALLATVARHYPALTPHQVEVKCKQIVALL